MSGVDLNKLQEMVYNYWVAHVPELAEAFADELAHEFGKLFGEIPMDWLSKALNDIVIIDPVIEGDEIYCNVGWDYGTVWEQARVMVALYGNHDYQPFIAVKGFEATWQDDLVDPRVYHPEKDSRNGQPIPQFDREGIDAIDNATQIFQSKIEPMVEQIKAAMPIDEFVAACITL